MHLRRQRWHVCSARRCGSGGITGGREAETEAERTDKRQLRLGGQDAGCRMQDAARLRLSPEAHTHVCWLVFFRTYRPRPNRLFHLRWPLQRPRYCPSYRYRWHVSVFSPKSKSSHWEAERGEDNVKGENTRKRL